MSVSEWAQVLETVLRLDLPWRTLRPHLARLAPDGSVEYLSCFDYMGPGLHLPQVRSHTTVCRRLYPQRLTVKSDTCGKETLGIKPGTFPLRLDSPVSCVTADFPNQFGCNDGLGRDCNAARTACFIDVLSLMCNCVIQT